MALFAVCKGVKQNIFKSLILNKSISKCNMKNALITFLLSLFFSTVGEHHGERKVTLRCPETRKTNVVLQLKPAILRFKDSSKHFDCSLQ